MDTITWDQYIIKVKLNDLMTVQWIIVKYDMPITIDNNVIAFLFYSILLEDKRKSINFP